MKTRKYFKKRMRKSRKGGASFNETPVDEEMVDDSQTVFMDSLGDDIIENPPSDFSQTNQVNSQANSQSNKITCVSYTMEDRMDIVKEKLENVSKNYTMLMDSISQASLKKNAPQTKGKKSKPRDVPFQMLKISNVELAFNHLSSKMSDEKRFGVLGKYDYTGHYKIIRDYEIKMLTSVLTESNAFEFLSKTLTVKVNPAVKVSPIYQYLECLFTLMINNSTSINKKLHELSPECIDDNSYYVHSGGNIFVLVAGMLCYMLHCDDIKEKRQGIIENVRNKFKPDYIFMDALKSMLDEEFMNQLFTITSTISDSDFLFMTKKESLKKREVQSELRNTSTPYLTDINNKSALLLRELLSDGSLVPLHIPIPIPFRMSNFSGLTQNTIKEMDKLLLKPNGVLQTSNIINVNGLHIILNRLKICSELIHQVDIPPENQFYYSKKGEWIDLCISTRESPQYVKKMEQFIKDNYYSLEMIEDDTQSIVDKLKDDKTDKRKMRLDFLKRIKRLPRIEELFQIIGEHIQYVISV